MYEHKLIFECEVCKSELAHSQARFENNLEPVDANLFNLACDCGRQNKLFGVQAKKHWTESEKSDTGLRSPDFGAPYAGAESARSHS